MSCQSFKVLPLIMSRLHQTYSDSGEVQLLQSHHQPSNFVYDLSAVFLGLYLPIRRRLYLGINVEHKCTNEIVGKIFFLLPQLSAALSWPTTTNPDKMC